MGSPYAASILREDVSVDREGFVSFTDPGNQPAVLRGPFPFTHSTAGVTAGVPIYTPNVGDVILDIGIQLPVAFNGTTPMCDVGTFNGGSAGLFDGLAGAAVNLADADAAVTDNAGLSSATTTTWLAAAIGSAGAAGGASYLPAALYVTVANPLLLVVSQSGMKGGTATGATAGTGAVYVITSSPVPF
jgi:hypothetical protein